MVIKTMNSNIFNSDAKHIAFAINKEGINDSGFAGKVAEHYWEDVAFCGQHEIGDVLSKKVGDRTFHALVCHSLYENWGDNQEEIIRECFDKIDSAGEPISSIAIGTGFVGAHSGADFRKIVCGMHDSNNDIVLYAPYTLQAVLDCYFEEKGHHRALKK